MKPRLPRVVPSFKMRCNLSEATQPIVVLLLHHHTATSAGSRPRPVPAIVITDAADGAVVVSDAADGAIKQRKQCASLSSR